MEGLKGTAIRSAVRDPSCPQAPVFGGARRLRPWWGVTPGGWLRPRPAIPGHGQWSAPIPGGGWPVAVPRPPWPEGGGFAAAHPMEGCRARAGGRAAQGYGTGPSSQSVAVIAGRRAQV